MNDGCKCTLPELGCIGLYIPSALGMSLGPQDVPRPSGHILGLGKSLGRQRCKCQYIPPLVSVCTFSLQISKSLWNNDDVDGENFNFSNFSERSRSIVAKISDLGPPGPHNFFQTKKSECLNYIIQESYWQKMQLTDLVDGY